MKIISPAITKFLLLHFRYVLAFVVFCVLILGYLLIVGPEVKTVRQIGVGDLKSETKRLEDRKSFHARLTAMLEQYDRLNQSGIGELSKVLPSKSDISDLFIIVEAVAEQSELRLVSISINPSTQAGKTSAATSTKGGAAIKTAPALDPKLKALDVSVTVKGDGSYNEFKNFLVNIEDNLRFFNVQSITFTPKDESTRTAGDTPSSQYSLNLITYYLYNGEQ
jgi:Tfp pilus assembly protein PilO